MSMSDELKQLSQLHESGALSAEEFTRAKARVLNGQSAGHTEARVAQAINALQRSREESWLGGVCGGLAQLSGMAAWLWRAVFVLFTLCGGAGVLAYLLLWIFVPQAPAKPLQLPAPY